MSESRMVIECPVCRCRMEVQRGAARAYTCRNGHRFIQTGPPGGSSTRRPRLLVWFGLLIALALLVAFAVAVHRWPAGALFPRTG
jgi:hypothetical protein